MGAAFTVREATLHDVDRLIEVHIRARLAYYGAGGLPPEQIVTPTTREELHTGWSEAVESSEKRVWCATLDDGDVVGITAMGPPLSAEYGDDRSGQLYQIHVAPDWWGRGIGSALHAVFLRYLVEVDRPTGVLEAWERNVRAQSFYARHGWLPAGGSRPGPDGSRYLNLRLARGDDAGPTDDAGSGSEHQGYRVDPAGGDLPGPPTARPLRRPSR